MKPITDLEVVESKLRLSYVSEPGDRLSDLGDGKVLIRNPDKPDRVLDRKTGEIIWRKPNNLGLHLAIVIGTFIGYCAGWASAVIILR